MTNIIEETQNSYYEYISQISRGSFNISNNLRLGNITLATTSIIDLVEGLSWLLQVEEAMKENNYVIKSATQVAAEHLNEINEALSRQDYVFVADLFEYEISPIFEDAENWKFEKINVSKG
ncbi:hypothetical protein PGC35_01585 [Psychrobacillus sp. PGGUH221]|uniref:hypothetical protein n=1 Tax=Psychrobacillus sp. PGGUH221 TaxID=3020058 RepID=UPI0035C68685